MIKHARNYASVNDVVKSLETPDNYKIQLSFTENNDAHTLTISGKDFLDALLLYYSFFRFVHIKNETDFTNYFNLFKSYNIENINRLYFALYKTYNPVENYDKHSTITNTPNKNGVDMTTENKDLIETTMTKTNEVTVHGNRDLQGETIEYTHGNIGTTKSTDMINDEIFTRMTHNLLRCIIDMFAKSEIIC